MFSVWGGLSVQWPQGESPLRRAPRPQGPTSEEAVGLAVQGLLPSVPWTGCRDSPQSLEVLVPPEEKTPHSDHLEWSTAQNKPYEEEWGSCPTFQKRERGSTRPKAKAAQPGVKCQLSPQLPWVSPQIPAPPGPLRGWLWAHSSPAALLSADLHQGGVFSPRRLSSSGTSRSCLKGPSCRL